MITCLIIAEKITIDVLSHHISKFPSLLTILSSTDSYEEGLRQVSFNKPAIVYIDDKCLSQYAAELQSLKRYCFFVILSEANTDGERNNNIAFEYLIKPLQFSHFINSIKNYGAYLYHYAVDGNVTLSS